MQNQLTSIKQKHCPLCNSQTNNLFHRDKIRSYFLCPTCSLVFVPKSQHLAMDEEKKCYDHHENNPEDLGYRKFLSRLSTPLIEKLNSQKQLNATSQNSKEESSLTGLDFGCGPGPTLSIMLQEAGFTMNLYDIYYQPDTSVLQKQYDFITSTEVFEHLSKPYQELERLLGILKQGGYLGIMTKMVLSQEKFVNWHYILDPTHISFFSQETFQWIAKEFSCTLEFFGNDVIFLKKNSNII